MVDRSWGRHNDLTYQPVCGLGQTTEQQPPLQKNLIKHHIIMSFQMCITNLNDRGAHAGYLPDRYRICSLLRRCSESR